MIDKSELIQRIEYASKYNEPCPTWVYNLIAAMPDVEGSIDLYDILVQQGKERMYRNICRYKEK